MKSKKKKTKGERRKYCIRTCCIFLLAPSLIGVICFSLIPLIISLYVSLTDWNFSQGLGNWNFIGLTNFINPWKDEWFLASLKKYIDLHRRNRAHRTFPGNYNGGTD